VDELTGDPVVVVPPPAPPDTGIPVDECGDVDAAGRSSVLIVIGGIEAGTRVDEAINRGLIECHTIGPTFQPPDAALDLTLHGDWVAITQLGDGEIVRDGMFVRG
jgi:hypothetical protein